MIQLKNGDWIEISTVAAVRLIDHWDIDRQHLGKPNFSVMIHQYFYSGPVQSIVVHHEITFHNMAEAETYRDYIATAANEARRNTHK